MSTATLKTDYKERIVPALEKEFNYSSVMQVPRLEKIVINEGLGAATQDNPCGSSPYPRLQGYRRKARRTRQLHTWHHRADHLPGNQH